MFLGSTPSEEPCVQVEPTGAYREPMRAECERFRKLIRLKCGEEPEGAYLTIKGQPHEFGTYYEVAVAYDDENEEAVKYAYKCENETPTTWLDSQPTEKGILHSKVAQNG
jgi:hypothetical protein